MYSVLLIDDEEEKKKHIEFALEDIKDLRLVYADTVQKGLQLAAEAPYDLIVLDYYVTNGHIGTELIPDLKKLNAQSNIVMFTSSISLEQALDAGADTLFNPTHVDVYERLEQYVLSHQSS